MSDFKDIIGGELSEQEKAEHWFVYHGLQIAEVLDYDPISAIRRLESDVQAKQDLIDDLFEQNSDMMNKVIEAERLIRDAHIDAAKAKESYNLITALNCEIRLRCRQLQKKIHNLSKGKYGKPLD